MSAANGSGRPHGLSTGRGERPGSRNGNPPAAGAERAAGGDGAGLYQGNGHVASGHRWQVRIIMPGLPLQACSVLLTRVPPQEPLHVLVDTGFPQHDTLVLDGLRQAGLTAADVHGVINTHYHLDHCGGNFLFPKAWIYGSRCDFDWAMRIYESVCGGETRREVFRTFYPEATDAEFERMDQARMLQLLRWMWDPATLGDVSHYRWAEQEPLGLDGIEIVPTPGHTPGHISIAVAGADGRYLIAGDARSFLNESASGSEMPPHNAALYRASRARLDSFEGMLLPGHDDPFPQGADETATAVPALPGAQGGQP